MGEAAVGSRDGDLPVRWDMLVRFHLYDKEDGLWNVLGYKQRVHHLHSHPEVVVEVFCEARALF